MCSVSASQPSSCADRTATRHAVAVASGVRIFGVDGGSHGPHHAGEQFRLLAIQIDVAAVNAQHRADRAEQAGLGRTELARRTELGVSRVVEGRQPAEQPLAFSDRHDHQLPNAGRVPTRHVVFVPIDDQRPIGNVQAQLRDNAAETGHVQRALAVGQQYRLRARVGCDQIPIGVRRELQRQPFGRHDLRQPLQCALAELFIVAGELEVLSQPIEQADFLEGRAEMDGKLFDFAFELFDVLIRRHLRRGQIGHATQELGVNRSLALRPRDGVVCLHAESSSEPGVVLVAGERTRQEAGHGHQPLFGSIADRQRQQQPWLFFFDKLGLSSPRNFAGEFGAHRPVHPGVLGSLLQQFARLAVEQRKLRGEPATQGLHPSLDPRRSFPARQPRCSGNGNRQGIQCHTRRHNSRDLKETRLNAPRGPTSAR